MRHGRRGLHFAAFLNWARSAADSAAGDLDTFLLVCFLASVLFYKNSGEARSTALKFASFLG
jgi:hypothetical protein